MKRLIVIALSAALIFALCACGSTEKAPTDPPAETVLEETSEWEVFIAEYDAWVDKYIEIVNKYKADPTDTSILTDYTEMAGQVAEWSTKAESFTEELKNSPKDAEKYAAELLKIANKLAAAAQ